MNFLMLQKVLGLFVLFCGYAYARSVVHKAA
jgi:hypothetical protein